MSVLMRTTHSTHIEHMTRPLWHSHSACGRCLQMQTEGQAGVEVINQDGQLFVSGADGWREVVVATKADLADWADYVTDLALQGLVCASCAVCYVFQARACVLCGFVGLSVVTAALGAQGGGGDGTGGRGVRGRHRLHRWFGVSRVGLVTRRSVCMHALCDCFRHCGDISHSGAGVFCPHVRQRRHLQVGQAWVMGQALKAVMRTRRTSA